jgi:hypothetical protein
MLGGGWGRDRWLDRGGGMSPFTGLAGGVRPRGALEGFSEGRALAPALVGVALRGALVVDNTFDRRTFVGSGVILATFRG